MKVTIPMAVMMNVNVKVSINEDGVITEKEFYILDNKGKKSFCGFSLNGDYADDYLNGLEEEIANNEEVLEHFKKSPQIQFTFVDEE